MSEFSNPNRYFTHDLEENPKLINDCINSLINHGWCTLNIDINIENDDN